MHPSLIGNPVLAASRLKGRTEWSALACHRIASVDCIKPHGSLKNGFQKRAEHLHASTAALGNFPVKRPKRKGTLAALCRFLDVYNRNSAASNRDFFGTFQIANCGLKLESALTTRTSPKVFGSYN